jgi:capsule polysaccharide modification protein KpsS
MREYTMAEHTVKAGSVPEAGSANGEIVSAAYVEEYIAIESRRLLFVSNGYVEEFRKTKGGVITVKSTAGKAVCRVVRFTPVSRNGGE